MLKHSSSQVLKGVLIVTEEHQFFPCKYDDSGCSNAAVESSYSTGQKVDIAFCLGVPEMECCPKSGTGLYVDGEFRHYETRRATRRMVTILRDLGHKVDGPY